MVGETMRDAGTALVDAGNAIDDAGEMMRPDAGAQQTVTCNRTQTVNQENGFRIEYRYAVVAVGDPRTARIEICYPAGHVGSLPPAARCIPGLSGWYAPGSNDLYYSCGQKIFDAEGVLLSESPDPVSITVYE